jgi:hypothetical protein
MLKLKYPTAIPIAAKRMTGMIAATTFPVLAHAGMKRVTQMI